MWQPAKDNFDLDPGWRWCRGCDMDLPADTPMVNGLCPECVREKELAEAAEEEMADAQEREEK